MILALDVGNTQIQGGVFKGDHLAVQFRKNSSPMFSSDEFGLFLRAALRENGINHDEVLAVSMCSVVPSTIYSIKSACIKYFNRPPFVLEPGVRTGLRIKYKNPSEVGTDRIANAIAATHLFPQKNLIIIDLGTATTFCVISKDKDYLGGTIIPGMKVSMQALEERAAKLSSVELSHPVSSYGQTTTASLQAGLYYSHLGAMKEIIDRLKTEAFPGEETIVIGTGGLSSLFENQDIFNHRLPNLVLQGLHLSYTLNL